MKNSVAIRKVDDLGRFVLPRDMRKKLNIRKGDYLELSVTEDVINIRKYSCIRDLEVMANILIESIYEVYEVDAVLMEGEEIVSSRNKKNILKNIKEEKYLASSIVYDGQEIGRFIIFSIEEQMKELLSFVVLFIKKYLEE